ncbi:MAG: hypothetical protein IK057_04625 [Clostridia bacterium]|nr:hypothetical protein [Clostridia bacterium]
MVQIPPPQPRKCCLPKGRQHFCYENDERGSLGTDMLRCRWQKKENICFRSYQKIKHEKCWIFWKQQGGTK